MLLYYTSIDIRSIFQINHQFNQFEKKSDYGELLLVNLKVSYRSLSNIPIMRRQVSALKGVMFPFNKAFLNSSAVILPDLSWSTAYHTKMLTMLNGKKCKILLSRYLNPKIRLLSKMESTNGARHTDLMIILAMSTGYSLILLYGVLVMKKCIHRAGRHSSVSRPFTCGAIGFPFELHQCLVTSMWKRLARLPRGQQVPHQR